MFVRVSALEFKLLSHMTSYSLVVKLMNVLQIFVSSDFCKMHASITKNDLNLPNNIELCDDTHAVRIRMLKVISHFYF